MCFRGRAFRFVTTLLLVWHGALGSDSPIAGEDRGDDDVVRTSIADVDWGPTGTMNFFLKLK